MVNGFIIFINSPGGVKEQKIFKSVKYKIISIIQFHFDNLPVNSICPIKFHEKNLMEQKKKSIVD